jgi:large subunit ribosomal protein L16
MQAVESGRPHARQIEAARMAIQRKTKRQGKLFIRIFPRQARHQEAPRDPSWVRVRAAWITGWPSMKAGRVLYEIEGVSEEMAKEAFRLAGHKLPVATRFVSRKDQL